MKKKGIIGSLTIGLLLTGAIAAGATNGDSSKNITVKNKYTEFLTVEEVKEIALTKYDGHIEEVELDDSHYEIEIETANEDIELAIDAYSGEILVVNHENHDDRDDRDDDSHENINNNQQNKSILTEEEVTKIAVDKTGATVAEIELDNDDGRIRYEIELYSSNTEIEMEIDASTGEILELEYDDVDDRHDD